jgi:hypothetical protein
MQEWYRTINELYAAQNFYRTPESILTHLVEVCAGLHAVASGKKTLGVGKDVFLVKAFTWWFALCGRVGIRDVDELLWIKFPGVCPYCLEKPCIGPNCKVPQAETPHAHPAPKWSDLNDLARAGETLRPRVLSEWQRMFSGIYPRNQQLSLLMVHARLTEEIGELSEAVRLLPLTYGFFVNEAIDVFAWLMALANQIDPSPTRDGLFLDQTFNEQFADGCPTCGKADLCICAPVDADRAGRLASELPEHEFPGVRGRLTTTDRFLELFGTNLGFRDRVERRWAELEDQLRDP